MSRPCLLPGLLCDAFSPQAEEGAMFRVLVSLGGLEGYP